MTPCCDDAMGARVRYISRGRTMYLCPVCLDRMLRQENKYAEGCDELSILASYYTPEN